MGPLGRDVDFLLNIHFFKLGPRLNHGTLSSYDYHSKTLLPPVTHNIHKGIKELQYSLDMSATLKCQ